VLDDKCFAQQQPVSDGYTKRRVGYTRPTAALNQNK